MAQATGNGETVAGACVQGRELQPLDADAVKRAVVAMLERADRELGRGAAGCNEDGRAALEQCAHDARVMVANLAAAVSALRLLEGVGALLERRIYAVCEVRGENYQGERYWGGSAPMFGVEDLPERFCGLVMDEEHPF